MIFVKIGLFLTVGCMCDALTLHEMMAETDSSVTLMEHEELLLFEDLVGNSIAEDVAPRRKRETTSPRGSRYVLDRMQEKITISEHVTSFNGFEFKGEPFAVAIVERDEEEKDIPKYILKLYRIQDEEVSTLQWIGLRRDGRLHVAQTDDTVLVVASDSNGGVVYAVEDFALRQLQNLSFLDANSVKLHAHQDKIRFGVALKTGFDLYEWEGSYFDKKASLAMPSCTSADLFTIDNTLYLATSSDDLFGIWERSVESGDFDIIQNVGSDSADDIKYFMIGDSPSNTEHYLAFASRTRSAVIYKRDFQGIFNSFQDFPAKKIEQWLPYQENSDEFALFGVEKSGVTAFEYDGYVFRENGASMEQVLGVGCSSLQAFSTKKGTWMAAVNPTLKSASLEEAIFKTVPATEMAEVESWCEEMESKKGATVEELVSLTGELPKSDQPVVFNGQVTFYRMNVTTLNAREFGIFTQELVDQINELSARVDQLGALVADLDTLSLTYSSRPVTLRGPILKSRLNVQCDDAPCSMHNVDAELMNGDFLEQFLGNTVNVNDAATVPLNMEFEHLIVKDATAPFINGKPARTLVYRNNKMTMQNVSIAGSVTFQDHVFVRGTVDGVLLDREHAVLTEGDQTLEGGLVMPEAVINSLSLSGQLNNVNVSQLGHALPTAQEEWRQGDLSVANLTILGSFGGISFERLINGIPTDELNVEAIQVSSEEISGVKLADLIRTDQGDYKISGLSFSAIPLTVDNLAVSETINNIPLEALMGRSELDAKETEDTIEIEYFEGNRVIVKNIENLQDIISPDGRSFLNWDQPDPSIDNADAVDDEFTCVNLKVAKERPTSSVSVTKRFDEDGNMYFEVDGPLTTSALVADQLEVAGLIDNMNWTELMVDAIRLQESTTVYGRKKAVGSVNLSELHVTDFFNGVDVDEVVKKYPEEVEDAIFAPDLLLESSLNVSEIVINGLSILKLDETDERVFAVNSSLQLGENTNVNKINNIDVDEFYTSSVLITEEMHMNTVNFVNPLQIANLTVAGLLNGANFTDVFLTNSSERQVVSGSWLFRNDVGFKGGVNITGDTSGMDLNNLCQMSREAPKVIVSGSVTSVKEPRGVKSVNYVEIDGILENAWFRNEKTTIEGRAVFGDVRMWENVNVGGQVNGVDLFSMSKTYLSKSLSRHMYADLQVSNLTIVGLSRTRKMSGIVNALNVTDFSTSVLQHGIEQEFSVHPNFENIAFGSISGNYSMNGLNLASDVLRYDVEGAIVTGEKTLESVVAEDIVVDGGVMVQNVAVAEWMNEAVLKKTGFVKGNVTFAAVEVEGSLSVKGNIGGIKLDRKHMLTTAGNQKITGKKTIIGDLSSSRLTVDGLINGVYLRDLVENAAYIDGDVVVSAPLELDNLQTEELSAEEVAGVNVSRVCDIANKDLVIRDLNDKYKILASASKEVHENIADGAYFLDFYSVVQKFKNNVSAVALVPSVQTGPAVAVFRESDSNGSATVMSWNTRENLFKTTGSLVGLEGDTKFISAGPSLLVAQNQTTTLFLYDQNAFWSDSLQDSSCAVAYVDPKYAACFFIGQKGASDVCMCAKENGTQLVVSQAHLTTDCIQATTVRAGNKTWLMVIGGKTRWSRSDVFLTVLSRRDGPGSVFIPRQDLAVLHPISITAAVHGRYCYLIVASQHKPESIRSSLVTVFRYTSSSDKWTRYQEILVDAPLYVHLAELPTGQLALYVVTENPAKAFQVFLYRGVEGFVAETAGLGVRTGSLLTSFTVSGRHYVAIAGSEHGQLLQAEMRGSRHV